MSGFKKVQFHHPDGDALMQDAQERWFAATLARIQSYYDLGDAERLAAEVRHLASACETGNIPADSFERFMG